MSRRRRFLLVATIVLAVVVGVATGVVWLAFPRSEPAPALALEATPERLERGRYLVHHVANCLDCHSERNWSFYGGPVVAGTEGKGAFLRVLRPAVESANITPAGLGHWTDGEIVRALTAGISRDGRALHPYMPYDTYAKMEEEDVFAVVAYLRSMAPIDHDVAPPEDILPIRILGRLLPKPYEPPSPVDRSDPVAYGRYLTDIAECGFCHQSDFSGGLEFRVPGTDQVWASENITPHASNRIGGWTKDNFIGVFKSFLPPEGETIPGDEVNTVMPWSRYAGMTEEDLGAIYEYLRTIPPVEKVESVPAEQTDEAASH